MENLTKTVQTNCHISDARYAGNYTLCIYLLKMREFYRWENNIEFIQRLTNDDVGEWLTDRESLWEELEESQLEPVDIQGRFYSPFDSSLINDALEENKLVYSGGYASHGKPVFFLAELEEKHRHDDYTLYVAGRELARDLTAPPGMASDKSIYIRKESLRRFIWEKFEESHWHKQANPLSRALNCYDFQHKPIEALDKMTNIETDTVLHHEIGEIMASNILGDDWDSMVMNMPRSKVEFMARAIKDHLADALSTLPKLVANPEPAQIHFYFANMTGMRKVIFPSLHDAYTTWINENSLSHLQDKIEQSRQHWETLGKELIELFQANGNRGYDNMQELIDSRHL